MMPASTPASTPATPGISLWRAVNPPMPVAEPLHGMIEAEIAVVGAGIAGLSTALHLAREGRQVVVVDAVQASTDGASTSAGLIAPQLVRNTPASVLRKLGTEAGTALLRMIAESGRHAFDLIAEYDIACAPQNAGFLAPTFHARGLRQFQEVIADWRAFRTDLRLLDAEETAALSGCPRYAGAILDENGGGLDPVALLHGLERALIAAGGRVCRGSRVTGLTQHGSGWDVATGTGILRARSVMLCANGGNADLHPALKGSVLPLPVCEVATGPLSADLRRAILPRGHSLTDTATDVFSIRFDRDGRLITAQAASATIDAAAIERQINDRLEGMLPAWRRTPLDFIWRGTAWVNGNLLPRAVALDEGLTAIQACNGRGLAMNLIAGREMARWLIDPSYRPLLPLGPPRRLPGFAVAKHVPRLMMTGSALVRRMTAHLKGQGAR